MNYLLDTNVWVHLFRGTNRTDLAHYTKQPAGMISICDIVVADLRHGAAKSKHPIAHHAVFDKYLQTFPSLSFNTQCARCYGELKADLERRGQRIGEFDIHIAATALAHGLTLVSHNTAEFSRVSGLSLEDWEMP